MSLAHFSQIECVLPAFPKGLAIFCLIPVIRFAQHEFWTTLTAQIERIKDQLILFFFKPAQHRTPADGRGGVLE